MRITDIKVFPVREEKLKAFVSIVLDECFMVNDIKVIRGKDGFFISMPSRRKRNGKFKDIAHPLNNETRRLMEDEILEAYEQASDTAGEHEAAKPARREARSARAGRKRRKPPVPEERSRPPRDEARPAAKPKPAAAVPPATPSQPTPSPEPTAAEDEGDKTLEEVAELHLRDSFWGT